MREIIEILNTKLDQPDALKLYLQAVRQEVQKDINFLDKWNTVTFLNYLVEHCPLTNLQPDFIVQIAHIVRQVCITPLLGAKWRGFYVHFWHLTEKELDTKKGQAALFALCNLLPSQWFMTGVSIAEWKTKLKMYYETYCVHWAPASDRSNLGIWPYALAYVCFRLASLLDKDDPLKEHASLLGVTFLKNNETEIAAVNDLAVHYLHGLFVVQDQKKAFLMFKKIQEDFAHSAYNLARCYTNGAGVAADPEQAFLFFKRAAMDNFAPAQFALINCYYEGIGVASDPVQTFLWCKRAAENSILDAQFSLAMLYSRGIGVVQSYDKALVWLHRAAEMHQVRAQYELGCFYSNANSAQRDTFLALTWFMLAASQGHPQAQDRVDEIKHEALAVEEAKQQRLKVVGAAPEAVLFQRSDKDNGTANNTSQVLGKRRFC